MIRRCRSEQDVHGAAMTGRWTPALLAHAKRCDVCGDIRLVASALQAASPASLPTADPRVLWTSARHARRFAVEARISFVVMTAQVLVLVAALSALLSFVNWQTLRTWATWRVPVEGNVWTYGAMAVGALALFGVSRWVVRDSH